MPTVFSQDRKAIFILAALLIMIGVIQSQNMFRFPYYQNDEGTYMADTWSITHDGKLSPYTYSYQDPPAGSVLLAGWTAITGGISAFGFPLNSGRVLMLILHVIAAGLVYMIGLKLTRSNLTAIAASFVFAFSPLAVSLQRIVVLDNIMIVWLLAALYLVVGEHRTLNHYFASAVFFGLAVLSKGSALYFLPALLIIIRMTSHPHHRRFATILWVMLALVLISVYPLYAQMKEELFPRSWVLGGDFPHVSLLEQIADRGPDTGRFLNYGSGLGPAFKQWVNLDKSTGDPVLIYGGLIAIVFVILLAIDDRRVRPLPIMLVFAALMLLFHGPVYNIDAITLLPFLALSIGVVIGKAAGIFNQGNDFNLVKSAAVALVFVVMLYPFWSFNASRLDPYVEDQVDGQLQATDWINEYVPSDALIVTDNYAFVALRGTHPNVHSYWRVDTDPAVKFNLLNDDLCRIDYLITTPQVYTDIQTFNFDLLRRTIERSSVLMTYPNNGWPIEIRQVNKADCAPQVARTVN